MAQTFDPEGFVQRQLGAYNARDLERFVREYTEDVVVYRIPDPNPFISGRAALVAHYRDNRFSLPELHANRVNRMVFGNKLRPNPISSGGRHDSTVLRMRSAIIRVAVAIATSGGGGGGGGDVRADGDAVMAKTIRFCSEGKVLGGELFKVVRPQQPDRRRAGKFLQRNCQLSALGGRRTTCAGLMAAPWFSPPPTTLPEITYAMHTTTHRLSSEKTCRASH